ncbi:M14 family zinc carboxypeptidase [Fodinibius sediminis]|uniref:Zinc carboxypeptidase n=1 Tax=Fodinibius sediminis TaxID=1214077 RepID=A0A521BH08_9BACT|nr:M14 family zinc carboxypeptidase [Fodinibius sediminis]SMO46398.1 Zinc carboxypeptidase [Fodinibius sediminis]
MMRFSTLLAALSFFLLSSGVRAQNPADAEASMEYYLPAEASYDSSIPTPEEVLGTVPGQWHVRHDQLVQYMQAVAEASDRVTLHEYGKTYEDRPLLYLTITSPENHGNIDRIRQEHLALTDPDRSGELDTGNMPIVLYMGYSIHGDEPSGANASLLVAYHLAAAQGGEVEQQLANSIVLLDPSLNPDGLNRFASWANTHKSKNVVSDPNSMELNQRWPSGRTNHYWFDLNRDWMLVQHPESQGRIENFHRWMPNILTDHHEMGTNATFFFQPGIQSRTHPITSPENQELTKAIAGYHADKLDKEQHLYYSEESYDDFYYGKGSTYPDVNGGIGILFEQASSRGHAQESIHGVLTFPFTIKNQFLTSLSTLEAAQDLRVDILNYQRDFFKKSRQAGDEASTAAYVFGTPYDRARTHHFVEMLKRHRIELYELAEDIDVDGESFEAGSAYVVPSDQKKYKFIKALFERRTTFSDSLFYDVSTWTMPYAFNLPFVEVERGVARGDKVEGLPSFPEGEVVGGRSSYAYLFEWDEYYAPRALYRLLDQGVRAKVATKPFTMNLDDGEVKTFDYGTVMVPLGPQRTDREKIHQLIEQAAEQDGVTVYGMGTGLTSAGIDLGSGSFEILEKPSVAIVSGEGASSYEVGEVWHLLDQRYEMQATLLPGNRIARADLSRYNVMVMVNGRYDGLANESVEELRRWVQNGGTLITTKYANNWAREQGLAHIKFVESEADTLEGSKEVKPKAYADMNKSRGAQYIGGSIFHAILDLTHPLGYGYNDNDLTVFRNSTLFMKKAENPYATPLYYTDEPLASGYISDDNLKQLSGTAAIVVSDTGSGRVISMTDNPNFRAFWYGTNKLFLNAVFFGQTIAGSSGN